uniref:Uncharacterized protein n=1 Tax=Glossina austeni TaxID=7395 RepID=A0A1A9VT67_GLOAU
MEKLSFTNTLSNDPHQLSAQVNVKLTCNDGGWDSYYNYGSLEFECKKVAWNLYESSEAFRWCPEFSVSYIIAKKNVNKSPTHIAGLCYDTERLLLSSIAYNTQPDEFNFIKTKFDLRNYSFGKEVTNFQSIEEEGLTPLLFEDKQFQDWFTFGNFHYAPLIENIKLKDVTEKFGALLNVTWWSNLRLGNWKKYRNALEKHTTKAAYNVISGIGGKLEVPDSSDCDNTTEMKVLVDKYDRYIPAYIWNYLEPLQNTSKEFAIIAFNSPFYEFYKKDEIVFCEDICHEIDWLANVRSTFQYVNMGIMFCCRIDEVQKSKLSENFPNLLLKNDQYVPGPVRSGQKQTGRFKLIEIWTKPINLWLICPKCTTLLKSKHLDNFPKENDAEDVTKHITLKCVGV